MVLNLSGAEHDKIVSYVKQMMIVNINVNVVCLWIFWVWFWFSRVAASLSSLRRSRFIREYKFASKIAKSLLIPSLILIKFNTKRNNLEWGAEFFQNNQWMWIIAGMHRRVAYKNINEIHSFAFVEKKKTIHPELIWIVHSLLAASRVHLIP